MKTRLLSLDVFRGATVAAMILVNNPGSWGHIYPPLEHASWNGCTPTDMIFPFFIFIVGVSIVFSLQNKKPETNQHKKLLLKILKRAIILFLLGLLLALFPAFEFSTVRIPGVLQRISIAFLITSIIFLKTNFRAQFWIFCSLLVLYWLAMTFIPVPGIGFANLQPETNLGAWLDRKIITEAHLWKSTKTWDPEGILSTMPAVSSCLAGTLTAQWLQRKGTTIEKNLLGIISAGVISSIIALIWDSVFPINKSLWTSSYVLYTGGLAAIFFGILYWIIDVQGRKNWTLPFVAFGLNAITVFFLSGIIAKSMNNIKVIKGSEEVSLKTFLYESYFSPYFSELNASLAWAICFVSIWFLILWMMYKRNIIIKV
ncbi:acyltransferase family protein [Desertivirga arenae]|uniref:acyltransferase family protein n=1 Tax=Desertivirga arenae TaxID=2810309 RepID=UPI001A97C731|nr:heparan-alpha-glucosaminide N-acetyltransferase domain-containing protein [Pedobacter sp. SYSU D00823]